ncbi:zinc-binding protein A33 [Esox lucius]|uniref:Zinc-binding protein A33-like n=1 Tax=Esox lucius TaxID=8010 RepID=A0AAY5JZR5_ESOLU|nr:zinc-binding protein A33 [Esox lucius]
MAFRSTAPDRDLCCPICHDIFITPVVLRCSHNFCKACLEPVWKLNQSQECPLCRRRSMNDPPINVPLKIRCENFLQERDQRASVSSGVQGRSQRTSAASGEQEEGQSSTGSEVEQGSQKAVAVPVVLCDLHAEKLKLFCLDDKQPICVVCRDSKKHRTHICVPVDEAVQDYKEELQTLLVPLQEKLKLYNEVKLTCDKTVGHIKNQAQNTEKRINQEFEIFRAFLRDEEAARIAALRTEEEHKTQTMNNKIEEMNRDISLISDLIRATEKELKAEDLPFLQNFEDIKERSQCSLPDPQLVSGSLIDVAEHLGNLQFRVWEKMRGIFKYTPVILDPNTAHWGLCLTDDLTGVRRTSTLQPIPDNPERCMKYVDVLGSEGFSAGVHSWAVEVGNHPNWFLGVAKESINRRGELGVSPKDGVWCLMLQSGRYRAGGVDDITLKRRPQRIRVQLDYDNGEVSFYDSKDLTLIHTHRDTFTERMFPYFHIGKAGDANVPAIKICQSVLSLNLM